jgi:mannose-6-phosphate isomerase-like protein (cupin superfamily)
VKELAPIIRPDLFQRKKDHPAEIVYELFTPADGLPFSIAIADIQQSEAHFHKLTTETYTVVQGAIELSLDDERIVLRSGDTVKIMPGVIHSARSLDKTPARITVTTVPRFSEDDYFLAGSEGT